MPTHQSAGFTRIALLAAASLGLSAFAAAAAQPNVTVPLNGQDFGNNNDLHAQSTGPVNPAAHYYYRITGTCHGTGDYANFVPPGTKIADLVDQIQPGASKSLTGVKQNPGSKLPFAVLNKTYQGSDQGADFSITLKINIDGTGVVKFDVENVSVTFFGSPISGTIVFEPGAKVAVGVAPTIEMAKGTQSVGEGAGNVAIKVNRSGNLGVAVDVHFATAAGTADKNDFKPTSGMISFDAGQASKTVKIPIKDNTVKDGSRSFKVNLSDPVAAILGTPKTTSVTITDND